MNIRRLLLSAALLALALPAAAQTPLEFSGPLRFDYVHDGSAAQAPLLASDVGGTGALPAAPAATTEARQYQLRVASDGTLSWVTAAGEPAPPAAHIAWSDDATFTEAEFLAGTSVTGARKGVIPTRSSGFGHLGLWLAGTAWGDIVSVLVAGSAFTNSFGSVVSLTVGGVAGQYRATVSRQSGPLLGAETMAWR